MNGRTQRSRLILLSGLPGSGKTNAAKYQIEPWYERMGYRVKYVCRDKIRVSAMGNRKLCTPIEKMSYDAYLEEIQNGLDEGCAVIADATHLTPGSRERLLSQLVLTDTPVDIFMIDTPLDVCLARNAKKHGRSRVPEQKLRDMYRSMTRASRAEYPFEHIRSIQSA